MSEEFKLYRIVSGIILDDDKVLLVKSRDEGNDTEWWGLPGGVVEGDETLKEALCREVQEETGLESEAMRLAYIHESFIPEFSSHSLVTAFKVEVKDGTPAINDPDKEVIEFKWVKITQADQYIRNEDVVKPLLDWYDGSESGNYFLTEKMEW